jgi:hypothetical protein
MVCLGILIVKSAANFVVIVSEVIELWKRFFESALYFRWRENLRSLVLGLYHKILKIAQQREDSISKVIKQFIESGMYELEHHYSEQWHKSAIEKHCHHLDIQSNALLKKLAMKLLDLSFDDLETFKQLSEKKYSELSQGSL